MERLKQWRGKMRYGLYSCHMYVEIMVTKWLPDRNDLHGCVKEHRKEIPFTVYENKFWEFTEVY